MHYEDVLAAYGRIKEYIYETPLERALSLDGEVWLKLECQQKIRAFKARGALSKLSSLTQEERTRGVAAISSGNHGAGVSYAANVLGIKKAVVFVPQNAPKAKVDKIRYFGATLIQVGQNYDETHQIAMKEIKKSGMTYIDPCSDRELIAGQGTIGLEILQSKPDIDVILVPVGGGGLITGIGLAAKAINPHIQVIGVQTEACPAMLRSLEDGVCYEEFPSKESACDALVGGVGQIPFAMAGQCIDRVLTVTEAGILKATIRLLLEEKVVAEPSGAVGVAALMEYPGMFLEKKVAVVISGGNLDSRMMREIVIQ